MNSTVAGPRRVHLVGSVPLENAEAVLRAAGTALGGLAPRLPDGETGERLKWLRWLFPIFENHPMLELAAGVKQAGVRSGPVRLKSGADAANMEFGEIGYAKNALESYGVFRKLRSSGVIPGTTRFQVSIPTPFEAMINFVLLESQAAVEPVWERRLMAEIETICAGIPHRDLALQWDVAKEVLMLEGLYPTYLNDPLSEVAARLARAGGAIPRGCEFGFHFCYGRSGAGGTHQLEPPSLRVCVELANAVCSRLARPATWFHMPVPIERKDEEYFRPLADLRIPPETTLYLGLVHERDGVEGARLRAAAAGKHRREFGVAAECGLAARKPETIEAVLRLHAEIAKALD